MTFASHVKSEVFQRAGNICECTVREHGNHFGKCRARIFRHQSHYHYVRLPAQGGQGDADNCVVLCDKCHEQSMMTAEN